MLGACARCGKEIETKNKGKKYCSKGCRVASRKGFKPTKHRTCKFCKNKFWPKTERQLFCCTSCSSKWRHKKWREEKKNLDPFVEKINGWDGEPWSTFIIYGAFNKNIQDARRPDFVLGF